jgi:hypothetical protein
MMKNNSVRIGVTIIAAFKREGVPPVVGLYIPVIESEYRECLESPVGAKGLFQFMPATAEGYGVPASERCNVSERLGSRRRGIGYRVRNRRDERALGMRIIDPIQCEGFAVTIDSGQ